MPVGLHYRVAFFHEGESRYGIVESHTPRAVEHAKLNELVVLDAVYPRTWFVNPLYCQDIPITPDDQDEFCRYQVNQHIRAAELSERSTGLKGKLLKFSAGRGKSAYYVITKVTKTLVHLEWRGFEPDRCTAETLGYFGRMDRSRAERLVECEESYRRRPRNPDE